ncbi:flagellar protein FlhE [Cronobacter muytjensii]|uniref:Flagellar protein FlhE n=1 Tax=Cronobacter muytjensii TaxID=413501 RepID=A0A2T7AKS3_9ENTR|nr:flagellar protein FlhE [Cronobacter muytjensii]ALB70227.1 flagellar protein flhE [Cronobacter muytjensii ATCC 51329]EGT4337603.1 flagellar protein FlhE [Cronobacter muytjensii]EKS1847139.1 flagellar protein FlhE [Cronobacter muytjensii]ELY2496193.1 flagellar protein FlhE [Cronobacter muytjensii]ELY3984888.1 flagellar protein FlhE [Cronobacter muytjensii]
MRAFWLTTLLMTSSLANAAGEGAWQASAMGPVLSQRGMAASSPVLAPDSPATGVMTVVAWRYELIGPTPAGLVARLCSQTRCVQVDDQAGTTRGFMNVSASEPLRFIFEVPGGGRLYPALQVRSSQVIVNYR